MLARPQMLGDDAFILDRHLIAGERHHPRALGAVPGVERKGLVWSVVSVIVQRSHRVALARRLLRAASTEPPLSLDLRAFPAAR